MTEEYTPPFEGIEQEDFGDDPFERIKGLGLVEDVRVGDLTEYNTVPIDISLSYPADSSDARSLRGNTLFFDRVRMRKGANNEDLPDNQQLGLQITKARLNEFVTAATKGESTLATELANGFSACKGKYVRFTLGPQKKTPAKPQWVEFKKAE